MTILLCMLAGYFLCVIAVHVEQQQATANGDVHTSDTVKLQSETATGTSSTTSSTTPTSK